jgi:hypothetical protein
MRLLLDECVPARFRRALPSHQISTVVQDGWSGIKNGKLLALSATSFDAFITVDKNLPYQQNMSSLHILASGQAGAGQRVCAEQRDAGNPSPVMCPTSSAHGCDARIGAPHFDHAVRRPRP